MIVSLIKKIIFLLHILIDEVIVMNVTVEVKVEYIVILVVEVMIENIEAEVMEEKAPGVVVEAIGEFVLKI